MPEIKHLKRAKIRLLYQFLVPFGILLLCFAFVQRNVIEGLFKSIQACLVNSTTKNINQAEADISSLLLKQGEELLKYNTIALLNEQLAYLEKTAAESKQDFYSTPDKLAEFCINDAGFQRIALKTFGKYGYTNASVRSGEKLISVAHAKTSLLGKDLFVVNDSMPAEDQKKQLADEFGRHWKYMISGKIEYEQTSTFLPAHIPQEIGRKKIAYHIWGEFKRIPLVVETTAYLGEFLEPVKNVKVKHQGILTEIIGHTIENEAYLQKQTFWLSVIFLVIVFGLTAIAYFRVVERPVRKIFKGLESFAEGDLDQRINCSSVNELGQIANISNQMAEKLALTVHSLEDLNKNLEEKVDERTKQLEIANKELEKRTEESDRLLLNTLPATIAARLKAREELIVDGFAMATVLFTDFKGFTSISETVTPERLVSELNEIFAQFDNLCLEYGIEKIKTIGDAYMAVGGVPVPDSDHPEKVLRLGIAMRDIIAERLEDKSKLPFKIRVGIHSGPLIAGVIGKSKFTYDLWGDTVNIASRCESTSEPMKVNVSESTYKLVKDKFSMESRGLISAKGKGELLMYFAELKS